MALTLPGEGETLHLKENPGAVKCFRFTAGIGGDLPLSAIAVVPAVNIPAGTTIHDVKTRVITAFTTSVTLKLGDGITVDGYMTDTIIAPATAVTTNIYKGMVDEGSTTFAGGKSYLVADAIDIDVGGAVVAAGLVEVMILYSEVAADS